MLPPGIAFLLRASATNALVAKQDMSLARQKGADVDPALLQRYSITEDNLRHRHVLGFKSGTADSVDSLSR